MSRTVAIEYDQFASALEDIFDDVQYMCTEALTEAVREGAKESAKEWRENAASTFNGSLYRKSIRYKVDKTGDEPQATVYSTMPGLPHLLEKGHATIGGGRVKAYPHIADAAEGGFEKASQTAQKGVDDL